MNDDHSPDESEEEYSPVSSFVDDSMLLEGGADDHSKASIAKFQETRRNVFQQHMNRMRKGHVLETEKKRRISIYGEKANSRIFEQAAS